ncbi:AraC family ligand binding domain-containing protein [Paenibacillus sp. P25]|nr:AraC family ligand binding domain-containing protein [Paenibacillus sp. P25]
MIRIKDVRQDAGTMPWYEEAPEESLSYSLILMGYGKCIYWVQGEKLILEKGEALLIPPGTVFYGKSIPSVSHDKFVVVYDVTAPDESLPLPLLRIRRPRGGRRPRPTCCSPAPKRCTSSGGRSFLIPACCARRSCSSA